MDKYASILDFSMPSLDPAIWGQDMHLYAYQRDFLLRLVEKMYETYGLKEHEKWVDDVVILGSITTSKWLSTCDVDVHIRVNLNEFVKVNMPGSSEEEGFKKLDSVRLEFDRAKILLPMTQHPAEFYFESLEKHPSDIELVGVYSLYKNEWLKQPVLYPPEIDFEETKRKVVDEAEALAKELDGSFGQIKRDINRVQELENVIKAWGPDKQKLFYNKIEEKINRIEEEIQKDIEIKEEIVNERHVRQSATSDIEIYFKYLARNGFFAILNELKAILDDKDLSVEDLPLIEKVISEASLSKTAYGTGWWMSPDGSLFEVESSHFDWVLENASTLGVTYPGEDLENPFEDLDDDEKGEIFRSMMTEMFEKGWVRFKYTTNELNVDLLDTNNIPKNVDNFIVQHPAKEIYVSNISDDNNVRVDYDTAINLGLQKAVNKALSHKRLQTASLNIESVNRAAASWIDPNGKAYYLDDYGVVTHFDFIFKYADMLEKEYGYADMLEKEYGYTGLNLFIAETGDDVNDVDAYLTSKNWSRIGDVSHSEWGIEVGDISDIPQGLITYLISMPWDDKLNFYIEDTSGAYVQVNLGELRTEGQKAVNRALSHKRLQHASLNKQAGNVIDVNGVRVFKNPSQEQAIILLGKSDENELRGLLDDFTNDLYLWDAYGLTHNEVRNALGIEEPKRENEMLYEWGAIDKNKINFIFNLQNKRREEKVQPTSSLKQAFLKEAFEEDKLVLDVDFDDTLAKENPDHTIGEPERS